MQEQDVLETRIIRSERRLGFWLRVALVLDLFAIAGNALVGWEHIWDHVGLLFVAVGLVLLCFMQQRSIEKSWARERDYKALVKRMQEFLRRIDR